MNDSSESLSPPWSAPVDPARPSSRTSEKPASRNRNSAGREACFSLTPASGFAADAGARSIRPPASSMKTICSATVAVSRTNCREQTVIVFAAADRDADAVGQRGLAGETPDEHSALARIPIE